MEFIQNVMFAGIRFHLYINTTPCGDARIFSPHEVAEGNDSHPDRKNRGLIRVKIEAGNARIETQQLLKLTPVLK